jgi:hypothetical protein
MRTLRVMMAALGLVGAVALMSSSPASAQIFFGGPGFGVEIGAPYYGYGGYAPYRYPGYGYPYRGYGYAYRRPYYNHYHHWHDRHER